jgi:hypothetical protein
MRKIGFAILEDADVSSLERLWKEKQSRISMFSNYLFQKDGNIYALVEWTVDKIISNKMFKY